MKSLGSFSITSAESRDFARTSGDFNPLHLDPVAARRTRFGQTLIHGVCGTVKALDLLLQQGERHATLLSIKVTYSKPATQGQELVVFGETTDGITRLEVFAEGVRCQIIDVELRETSTAPFLQEHMFATHTDSAGACMDLSIDACAGLSGAVDLLWDDAVMQALFPSATRYLPERQLATLVASTQIVGMRCPGLHSVFARLDLRFNTAPDGVGTSEHPQLAYRILQADKRLDRVQIGIDNAYAKGTIEAFFRPPPAQQASFRQIATMVSNCEFSDQNALIVGASRGLGEVITKVLAAGGARIMMTYAMGRDDAARVSDEIGKERLAPAVCFYNVLDGSFSKEIIEFCASVTHIYYLASPTISKSDSNRWDHAQFTRYCDFYINGLATLLQQVRQSGIEKREFQLFIPSSVFLEQAIKGFDEYIAAKAAAEAFVRSFEKSHRNWRVVAPRLPRLHTDQTSGVRDTDEQKTLNVIIDQLRKSYNGAASRVTNAREPDEI